MLNCREVAELCSEEMERPLRIGERVSMSTHLMMCRNCTNYRKQVKALRFMAHAYAGGGAVIPPEANEPPAHTRE
jgi:predicted anti-sigma-YlaC factor YlaD